MTLYLVYRPISDWKIPMLPYQSSARFSDLSIQVDVQVVAALVGEVDTDRERLTPDPVTIQYTEISCFTVYKHC